MHLVTAMRGDDWRPGLCAMGGPSSLALAGPRGAASRARSGPFASPDVNSTHSVGGSSASGLSQPSASRAVPLCASPAPGASRSAPSSASHSEARPAAVLLPAPPAFAREKRLPTKHAAGKKRANSTRVASSSGLVLGAAPASATLVPSGVTFTLNTENFTRARKRLTEEEKAARPGYDDVEDAKAASQVEWLASIVGAELRDFMLGGPLAVEQVPDEGERQTAFEQLLASKAASSGANLAKVRRSLEALARAKPTGHLPATALLLNRVVSREDIRARSAANPGSQGGATVAASIRSGFVSAQLLSFPVQADSLLLDAAAPPGKKRRRERRAGSIPLKWYFFMEHLAATMPPGPARFLVRQLLIGWMHSRLRFVDVMRMRVSRAPDDASDGCPVIMVITKFSKDGAPLDIYLRAEGFTGRWEWAPEHILEAEQYPCAIPAFRCPPAKRAAKGEPRVSHAGDVTHATEFVFPYRTASKAHLHASAQALTALDGLEAGAEVWKALGVMPHSGHGSASDQAATVGPHAPPDVAMTDIDERELGHWRRLATAAAGDGELQLDELLQQAADTAKAPRGTQPVAPAAMEAEDADMRIRYTSGSNREGRRRSQIRVHARWCLAVRRALAAYGKPWESLPGTRADYNILENIPPLE